MDVEQQMSTLEGVADIFDGYRLAEAWDEMFAAPGKPRAAYDALVSVLQPMDPGAAARVREILIEARREGDTVLRSVTDHGPGIPEPDRKHAVERFVRLEASRTQPGSGLGLSLASAVATLHGGDLRLGDNNPGLSATLAIPARVAAGDRLAAQTQDVPQKVA